MVGGVPYAKAEEADRFERPAAKTFLAEASHCENLEKLHQTFTAALEEAGFESHKYLELKAGSGTPPRAYSIKEPRRPGYRRLVVTVETWAGDWILVELAGHLGEINPAAQARASLLATLFAGRREQLGA